MVRIIVLELCSGLEQLASLLLELFLHIFALFCGLNFIRRLLSLVVDVLKLHT